MGGKKPPPVPLLGALTLKSNRFIDSQLFQTFLLTGNFMRAKLLSTKRTTYMFLLGCEFSMYRKNTAINNSTRLDFSMKTQRKLLSTKQKTYMFPVCQGSVENKAAQANTHTHPPMKQIDSTANPATEIPSNSQKRNHCTHAHHNCPTPQNVNTRNT